MPLSWKWAVLGYRLCRRLAARLSARLRRGRIVVGPRARPFSGRDTARHAVVSSRSVGDGLYFATRAL